MPITDLLPWNRDKSNYEIQRREEPSILDLQKEMNDIFDQFFSNPYSMAPSRRMLDMTDTFSPGMDISETDKDLIVTADLPGMDEKDVSLTIEGDTLTISGTKQKETETKEARMHRVERTFGSFKRSITLPGEVDINKVDATFQKGVLKVVIPKPANNISTVKKIPIKTR